jgi:hypothetical protein
LSLTSDLGAVLSLTKMLPLSDYWHHLLIILGVIIINIPLAFLLHKVFDKKLKI